MTDVSAVYAEQLAIVRAQEERTHRQRRLTNWLVVMFCCATLAISVYFRIATHQDVATIEDRQRTIVVNQHALGEALARLCIAEQSEANADGRSIPACPVLQLSDLP